MDPVKRMVLIGVVIVLVGLLVLFGIYYSGKRLQSSSRVMPAQEERKVEEVPLPEQRTGPVDAEPVQEPQDAQTSAVPGSQQTEGASSAKVDIIGEDELAKYLKIKDKVFPVYNRERGLSDIMLNQNAKWGYEEIMSHMAILGNMRIKKKVGLRDNDLAESRYTYISSAIMEWVLRTGSIPYKKKYIGDESFFTSKLSKVVSCPENDALFDRHKDQIAQTFMGDFELVDY